MTKGKDSKPHIGIFGRRNSGKSSFINSIVGQDVAIVSENAGTTTDPVKKSLEIFGIGPAIIIDTAGIDDEGKLGKMRVDKSLEAIKTVDAAILMISENSFDVYEIGLIKRFNNLDVPFLIIHNKSDFEEISNKTIEKIENYTQSPIINFSVKHPDKSEEVINLIKKIIPETAYQSVSLLGDLLSKDDIVLLITPIDSEAPEGRMILPQVMAIRDILDNECVSIVVTEKAVKHFLEKTKIKPKLAVTDSQAFELVKKLIPENIPLTSFSIVFARMKGNFKQYIKGTKFIPELKNGDRILILESCSHRISCEDIGRYKIPKWLRNFTGKSLEFDVVSGLNKLDRNINKYSMVIQCGGCVATRKQLQNRLKPAIDAGIPVSNYGMTIAFINGIFERAIMPFKNTTF
ncbi:MAG: [FeFe] hydrogenase H-cluster maturation GTPase HydF [Bacteroidales bacterium]|nr:[FeFe] hydrogenase H-cluster maturation GTPase HydF [Bacteroidales bacterium]